MIQPSSSSSLLLSICHFLCLSLSYLISSYKVPRPYNNKVWLQVRVLSRIISCGCVTVRMRTTGLEKTSPVARETTSKAQDAQKENWRNSRNRRNRALFLFSRAKERADACARSMDIERNGSPWGKGGWGGQKMPSEAPVFTERAEITQYPGWEKNECCEIYRYYFNCIVLFTQRAQIAQNLRAGGVTEWYLKTLERLFILLISCICSDNSCDACYRNRYLCRQIDN